MVSIAALLGACSSEVKDPPMPSGTGGSTSNPDPNTPPSGEPNTPVDPVVQERCVSTRQFFLQDVWPKVMSKSCINCHSPGGLASEQKASLLLYPTSYPGFVEENLASLRELAKTEYEDQSVLLRKPLGELRHGGGVQFAADTEEAKLLGDLVERLQKEETCPAGSAPPPVSGVELLAPAAAFRKASLMLVGRLPTADESTRLEADGEAALPGMIDALLEEPAFHDWCSWSSTICSSPIVISATGRARCGARTSRRSTCTWPKRCRRRRSGSTGARSRASRSSSSRTSSETTGRSPRS
jgi:hypothetical protein